MNKFIKNVEMEDFFYKNTQLIESKQLIKTENDEFAIKEIPMFQEMIMNTFHQFIGNSIRTNKNIIIDKFGQESFIMSFDYFYEKMDLDNKIYSLYNIDKELNKIMCIYYETLSKHKFTRFILFPEIQMNTKDKTIKIVPSKRLTFSIRNEYSPITDNDIKIDTNDYGRMPIEYHFATKKRKSMRMYELLIPKNKYAKNKTKIFKADELKEMLACVSYNKNSEIISKILKPCVESFEKEYGLKLFYKCYVTSYTKKIDEISFRVFRLKEKDDMNIAPNDNYIWDMIPEDLSKVFDFKSEKDYNLSISKKYTNLIGLEFSKED